MSYWLYSEILKLDDLRNPQFARTSTLNWMKALTFELHEHLGKQPNVQFNNLNKHFRSTLGRSYSPLPTPDIFEPLYSCLTYALTLRTHSKLQSYETWTLPSSIVEWYYCWYNAVRAMCATLGQTVSEHHAAVYRYYASSLFRIMPHPLNMHAKHIANEDYEIVAPEFPTLPSFDLTKTFPDNREAARGMIKQYIKGNADYYLWLTKEDILKRNTFKNFRSEEAKELRDARIDKYISFMHCAFRYRGKANYRDGIYLTYGKINSDENIQFLSNLADNAKIAFLIALALLHSTSLSEHVKIFIDDINRNLRGIDSLESADMFWNVL